MTGLEKAALVIAILAGLAILVEVLRPYVQPLFTPQTNA